MATLTQLNRNIRGGNIDRALAMIAPGDWLDGTDSETRDTALTAAISANSLVLVEALLKAGAKTEARSLHREAPLHRACVLGLEEIVRVLVDAGADVNSRTTSNANDIDSGQSVIMKAVAGNKLPIVKLLIEKGADPLAKDDYGNTALSLAQHSSKRIAGYLAKTLAGAGQKELSVHDAVRTRSLSRLQALASWTSPEKVEGFSDRIGESGEH